MLGTTAREVELFIFFKARRLSLVRRQFRGGSDSKSTWAEKEGKREGKYQMAFVNGEIQSEFDPAFN